MVYSVGDFDLGDMNTEILYLVVDFAIGQKHMRLALSQNKCWAQVHSCKNIVLGFGLDTGTRFSMHSDSLLWLDYFGLRNILTRIHLGQNKF